MAPEHGTTTTLDAKDPTERANLILEQAEKLDCRRYVTSKDIVEGSPNLNLAFVAQIFQHRLDSKLQYHINVVPDGNFVSAKLTEFIPYAIYSTSTAK